MKSLIITTGTKEWLTGTFLPTLFTKGKYCGDILIINYGELDLEEEQSLYREYDSKVFFNAKEKVYLRYTTDRFRAYKENLGNIINLFNDRVYNEYNVIMHVDGNDIEFADDIGPLLDQVKKRLLVVQEPNNNSFVTYWKTYWNIPIEFREAIKDKPIINAGMFLGPSKLMYETIKLIANFSEYDSRFGMDQLMLNVACYYYGIPYKVISRNWDWFDSWGKNKNAKILHHAGITGKKPNETDFLKPKNWLFPDIDGEEEKPVVGKHHSNWLFP